MTWSEIIKPVLGSPHMQDLKAFLQEERKNKSIYPASENTFTALNLCPYETVRVVILGQDPYHQINVADGIAFSTKQPTRPPSLRFIFEEIYTDLNIQWYHNKNMSEFFPSNNLTRWAQNGFLLLNVVLTVEQGKPGSHKGLGWEVLSKAIIDSLNQHPHTLVFLLWGRDAQEYKQWIDDRKHRIFEAPHPAAEAYKAGAGFIGCKHFSILRDILPTLDGEYLNCIDLKQFIDKDKLKNYVAERYPNKIDEIRKQFKESSVYLPLVRDKFYKLQRQFEVNLSTNINYNTYGKGI
jgi:uracil-DNA glycosylase